jgi:hypothetical protein
MKRILALVVLATPSLAYAEDVFRFDDPENIRVKVQKPEVSYVLNRPNVTPEYDFELKQSFLPRIEASVAEKPF